jgi:hypothetical protein
MFVDNLDVAPISMILTNLSGHAYGGEADVYRNAEPFRTHVVQHPGQDARRRERRRAISQERDR